MLGLPRLRSLDGDAGGRVLFELVGGPHDGALVVVGTPDPPRWPQPPSRDPSCSTRRPSAVAEAKAAALLESMLDPDQLRSWRRDRTFWVHTRFGPVRLGHLYDLEHLPGNGTQRRLCVVPRRHLELPIADIWVNLLLVLAHRPQDFFRAAVVRAVGPAGGTVPP